MNSRLDWLVLSDYYSIYVTNAPPVPRTRQRLRNQIKGLTKTVMPFFCWLLYTTGYAAHFLPR